MVNAMWILAAVALLMWENVRIFDVSAE